MMSAGVKHGQLLKDKNQIIDIIQHKLAQDPEAEQQLGALVRETAGGVISDVDVLDILRKLRHDSVGIGPLESLLEMAGLTDILVNAPDEVWFDRGAGLERSAVEFDNDSAVRRLATRLLAVSGRRLDNAQAYADGRIQRDDGTSIRVHAILSPPSESNTLISLRLLRQSTATLSQLMTAGTFSSEVYEILLGMVRASQPFIVVGGTGSGKTTLLGALLGAVPTDERIICIEDTAELKPTHPHFLTLITRTKNTEGSGEVTMTDLLKQALRMRPDRIVVGEIRGAEVIDLLSALNTGHDGCAGTIHANSLHEVPARLEALAATGGMAIDALHAQLAAAHPIVLAMSRTATGRTLTEIGQIEGNPLTIRSIWSKEAQAVSSCSGS